MKFPALSAPGKIGNVTIRNRIVVPAINNNYTHAAEMTERSIDCYVSKAKGGAGLIIVEATSVDYPQSRSVMNPALDEDRFMPAFQRIAEGCHAHGAKVFVQLTHVGRQTKKSASGMLPVAPSAIRGNSSLYPDPPRVLETGEIHAIVRKFGEAAERARKCGFDGIELHMGHGYLVNNFLSPLSNERTDEYGGLQGGIRFACELVKEVKRVCGADFPVSCRINGDDFVMRRGNTIVEYTLVAEKLEEAGADVINVTGGMRDSELNFNDHTCGTPHAAWLSMAERIKRCVSIPVISVKRFTPEEAERAVSENRADFIAFGKQSIADPSFASKILAGKTEEIIPCISCSQGCYDRLWMWKPITCAFNPEAGMTGTEMAAHESVRGDSRILVVGAGPAGMTVATELAKLGHDVTVIDKLDHVGGKYAYCSETVRKREATDAIGAMKRRMENANVKLLLGTPLTQDLLNGYEIAVNASGAGFQVPEPQEGETPVLTDPAGALRHSDRLGRYVVIVACSFGCPWTCRVLHNEIPDDLTGCKTSESHACAAGFAAADTAEELSSRGMHVEVITEREAFVPGIGYTNRNYLEKRLFTNNISVSNGVKILEILKDGLLCEKEGMRFKLAADSVVFSNSQRADPQVKAVLEASGLPYYSVGDCARPGNVLEAVHEAYRLAERITGEHPARS